MNQDNNTQGLENIFNIVSRKTIYFVIVIDSPNDQGIITQNFNSPLEFNPELHYNVSLLSFNASSSFPNISSGSETTPRNNKFYYSVTEPVPGSLGASVALSRDVIKVLRFDTGAYNIKDINDYLKDYISGKKITIELNAGSGKSIIKLKDNAKVYFGQYRSFTSLKLIRR